MSRYQWPNRDRKGKDRPLERMHYNALTDGILLDEAVRAARAERGAQVDGEGREERVAPTGDANLWVPIGPSTVVRGQATSRPRVAGRVRDLAVSDDGQRAYAATANGGVWFTSDGGLNWSPLGNWLATPSAAGINRSTHALVCGCLLVIFEGPADGSADTVYVGTGELISPTRGTPGAYFSGVGVLKLNKPVPDVLANPFGQHWNRELADLTGFHIFRLANEPGSKNVLVAATSIGLFARNNAGNWSRVTTAPFNFDLEHSKVITDVAWVNLGGGTKRLWVAMLDGADTRVLTSTSGVAGPFQPVALPNVIPDGRLGIAVAPSDKTILYVLGAGPRLWRISGVTPTPVHRLPHNLFMSAHDQSDYDLAIAVHPEDPNIIVVGGAGIDTTGGFSASLYKLTLTPSTGLFLGNFQEANQGVNAFNDPTFIGHGVHADVHKICFFRAGSDFHMWVGCDGGVYRSTDQGNRYTFLARNTGLAVLETGFLASHPVNEAYVIAGTQDNGMLMRVGDTIWMLSENNTGDGGGTMFHPVNNQYFVGQYTNSRWYSNGFLTQPVIRGTGGASETGPESENESASFYSGGDVCRVGTTSQVRLAIGTNRIWMVNNWNPNATVTNWVTLPSGNDPRGGTTLSILRNVKTDTYGQGKGQVIACRWATDSSLLVLIQSNRNTGEDSAVLLYVRRAVNPWEKRVLSEHANKKSAYSDSDIPQPTSTYLPPLGSWSDIAVHDASRGAVHGASRVPNGSCYVACTGHGRFEGNNLIESTHMDTLWWYDGTSRWHPTGLRNSGTKAPAYAVICDPANRNIVYVGTALGVWQGVLSFVGANPSWRWSMLSNGLPEAAVHDLSIYSNGTTKILRAAIQARGVWEVDLSTPAGPTQRAYLRVHANDARRAASTPLANPTFFGPTNWFWYASPDIRIRPAMLTAGEAIPRPYTTSTWRWINGSPNSYMLWVFQTALHKLNPLVRANGLWTDHFREQLLLHNAAAGNTIDDVRWGTVVTRANIFTAPWDDRGAGAGVAPEPQPTEADLFELVVENPPPARGGPAAGPPAVSQIAPRRYKIDVLVHYRDLRPVEGTNVRVALLRRQLPPNPGIWAGIALEATLKTRIVELMSGSPPGGWALPAPWTVADTGSRTRTLASPIDARTPRSVTFETNFAGAARGQHFLLLAVVHMSPPDAATPGDPVTLATLLGGTLIDLVQQSHHVAARVVRVTV